MGQVVPFHEGRADLAGVSISAIFDAWMRARAGCAEWHGSAGVLQARARTGIGLNNLRNWHAWLERLCRLGRLDDVTRYFCLE
jgi:hypothetical protein